jgi:hypothetical protein
MRSRLRILRTKKERLAKLDRARKAKRKAKAKAAKKPSLPDWKKSGEW